MSLGITQMSMAWRLRGGVGSCNAPFCSSDGTWGRKEKKRGRFVFVRSLSLQLALPLPFQAPAAWKAAQYSAKHKGLVQAELGPHLTSALCTFLCPTSLNPSVFTLPDTPHAQPCISLVFSPIGPKLQLCGDHIFEFCWFRALPGA